MVVGRRHQLHAFMQLCMLRPCWLLYLLLLLTLLLLCLVLLLLLYLLLYLLLLLLYLLLLYLLLLNLLMLLLLNLLLLLMNLLLLLRTPQQRMHCVSGGGFTASGRRAIRQRVLALWLMTQAEFSN